METSCCGTYMPTPLSQLLTCRLSLRMDRMKGVTTVYVVSWRLFELGALDLTYPCKGKGQASYGSADWALS